MYLWKNSKHLSVCMLISLLSCASSHRAKFNEQRIKEYREKARKMFYHAYDGYMKYAFPYDELRPLTCDGHNTWGSYSLSLIDSLDTLVVLGNYTEFRKATEVILDNSNFDQDINVSVFETNIRVVGGLLSAHLLSMKAGLELEPGWPCHGPLLSLAVDVAKRLLPAFDTPTGMPYGTVNLRYGVPAKETPVTCTAGVGTFLVEFGTLSRLTGDPVFEEVAVKAMNAIYAHRTQLGLIGNHVNVKTGDWTAHDCGIGAGVDSYFEYLLKGGVLLHRIEYLRQLEEYEALFDKYMKRDDWYVWVNMKSGGVSLPVFQSLEAFWPGLLSLKGNVVQAKKTLLNYFQVWEQFGATPEFFSLTKLTPNKGREGYPLRPELIESTLYVYQATGDPQMLHIGATIIEAIEATARTECGYAVIHDVTTHQLANRMESFFLAETTKYLYLLFDHDNFIHNSGASGRLVDTPYGQCVLDTGGYIFNTEAHPIDMAALDCCHVPNRRQFKGVMDDLDIVGLFSKTVDKKSRFKSARGKSDSNCDFIKRNLPTESVEGEIFLSKRDRERLLTCPVDPMLDKISLYGEIPPSTNL